MRKEGIGTESKEQADLYFCMKSTKIAKELKIASEKKGGKPFRKPVKCK